MTSKLGTIFKTLYQKKSYVWNKFEMKNSVLQKSYQEEENCENSQCLARSDLINTCLPGWN